MRFFCFLLGVTLIVNLGENFAQIIHFGGGGKPIKDALFLHNDTLKNNTLKDCLWRNSEEIESCDENEVKFILYAGKNREIVDQSKTDWLRQSSWNQTKENILIIHGYAGGDDNLPITVLRDAYLANEKYNVWMLNWGALTLPPCYRASIYNMKMVAKCTGNFLTAMRNEGLSPERTTCVGHSLGAHVCGLISRYVKFRLHRIVGLDPARPLVPPSLRLDDGNAAAVHILHTSAGSYGEMGRSGHVDFCINGGKVQPYCEKTESESLCSHVWVICYMAESVNATMVRTADPCSRRCPSGPRPSNRPGNSIPMGQFTPLDSSGSYCINNQEPPYCPKKQGDPGDKRCCL